MNEKEKLGNGYLLQYFNENYSTNENKVLLFHNCVCKVNTVFKFKGKVKRIHLANYLKVNHKSKFITNFNVMITILRRWNENIVN